MDSFNIAIKYHQAGQLRQAEQLYLQILQNEPDHPDANHFLGLCYYQTDRLEQAITAMRRSLELKPATVTFLCNLGLAYQALGKTDDAIATYEEILRLDPQSAEAHGVLANLLRPLGRLDEAVAHCRQALRIQPDFAGAYNNLGLALREQGKLQEAVAQYRQAIHFDPRYAAAQRNLGQALAALENFEEAEDHYHQALLLQPNFAEAHNGLGSVLQSTGRLPEAVTHIRQALQINPDYAEAHNNLGNALLRQEKPGEAESHYREAMRIKPEYDEPYNNLGALMLSTDKVEEGLPHFEQALRINPKYAEAHWNRSLVWLLQGHWERGWTEYEWRWRRPDFQWRNLPQPLWNGEDLKGKTILVQTEQGLGDTIHFIRYASLVKARGGRVVVQCQPSLVKLLSSAAGIDSIVPTGSPLPSIDVQVQLLSLPRIFRTTSDTVPNSTPYLHVEPELMLKWRQRLEAIPGFKIGIAWQGNPAQITDRRRSMPLRLFAPLAKAPGVQLISLQKGFGSEQLRELPDDFSVMDLGRGVDEESGPFLDTAAIMKNLDLVISSDTAIPHLAGALGVPVWVALPFIPDWRWLLHREDTPWYPNMRLFRQTRAGAWAGVFDRLAEALTKQSGDPNP